MRWFGAKPAARPARVFSLTASAQKLEKQAAERYNRLNQQWQERAFRFYDTLGECWYPAQGYARSMERIRFYPAVLNERGEPEEVEDGPLVELFERIQDPGGGGRSELAGSYGRLMFVVGDGNLTVTVNDDGDEQWEFLSSLEMRTLPDGRGFERRTAPNQEPQLLRIAPEGEGLSEGQARVWRLWRRHPTWSALADSPTRGVLELYELLSWLRLAASSNASSRAALNGGLFIPDEIDVPSGDVEQPDDDPESDQFTDRLVRSASNAIQNPGTAEAALPMVIRAKGVIEYGDKAFPTVDLMKWFPLGPERDGYPELEAADKILEFIANGLDLPVSWVTGRTGETENHWGGWLVDEQGFRLHIAGVVERFCRDLNSAYLRPAAVAEGVPDADRVVIWYDPAAAINHPDEIQTYREGYRDGVVGPKAYRDKIGAAEEDAPSEEELAIIFALGGKTLPGEETETPPGEGGMGGDADETPPEQNGNGAVSASALRAAHVLGALDLTVHRARELAGNRLRTRAQGCQSCRESIDGLTASAVPFALGAETVREINGGRDELQLVQGAADGVAVTIARWGVPADVAIELGQLAERHALRTLYEQEPPPLPTGVHAKVAQAIR